MRVSQMLLPVCLGLGALQLAGAATYTSQPMGAASSTQYVDLNNNLYALAMRQEGSNRVIVVENWNPANHSEFRPGTLPGTTRSIATDFNDSLAIVGWAETRDASGNTTAPDRAFLYSNGVFTDLGALPPLSTRGNGFSRAQGINNQGDVVGSWRDANGTRGFLYSNGVITDLGPSDPLGVAVGVANAINDSRQITGLTTTGHAFLYSNGSMQDLRPANSGMGSIGKKINARGEVIGEWVPYTHAQECFIYTGGAVQLIPRIGNQGYPYCSVFAINNSGVAVGYSNHNPAPPNFSTSAAFVYSNGQSADLNSLMDPNDAVVRNQSWLTTAVAINDTGYIIGSGGGNYYLLKPDSPTPSADNAYYNFEQSTHDWYNEGDPIVSVGTSIARKFAGSSSLAVQFNGAGYVSMGAMYPPPLAGKTVTFHVYLPADATIEWVQPFVLEDYFGNWAWHGNWQPVSNLQLGAWNTITLDIPADATPAWRMGVEFYTSQPYAGTVYIDSISF